MRAIITSDWHIRATRPRCRTDADWMETQRKALKQIEQYAIKRHCDVFVVGDLFHSHSDTNFECISIIQDFALSLNGYGLKVGLIAGNHDLPYHNIENIKRSAISILMSSTNIFYISDFDEKNISAPNFGEEVDEKKRYVFEHRLVIPKDTGLDIGAITAEELLEEHRNAEWIFTGDYHENFHYVKNNRHVVNPGCILRQVADAKDYQPVVAYVYTDEDEVEFLPIKDDEDVIDDAYLTSQKERELRIESFVDKLKSTESISLDFIENVKNALDKNNFGKDFKDVVEELLEV